MPNVLISPSRLAIRVGPVASWPVLSGDPTVVKAAAAAPTRAVREQEVGDEKFRPADRVSWRRSAVVCGSVDRTLAFCR